MGGADKENRFAPMDVCVSYDRLADCVCSDPRCPANARREDFNMGFYIESGFGQCGALHLYNCVCGPGRATGTE